MQLCICNLHYLDVIMDMLGNAKMREAILRYYQESGDPDAVYSAIKASEDDEDVTDNNHMGYFYNVFFGKKRCVTLITLTRAVALYKLLHKISK